MSHQKLEKKAALKHLTEEFVTGLQSHNQRKAGSSLDHFTNTFVLDNTVALSRFSKSDIIKIKAAITTKANRLNGIKKALPTLESKLNSLLLEKPVQINQQVGTSRLKMFRSLEPTGNNDTEYRNAPSQFTLSVYDIRTRPIIKKKLG